MELLDVGERIAIGRYRLHARFSKALIFFQEKHAGGAYPGLACVVDEGKGDGPLNLVVRWLDFEAPVSLEVQPDRVILGGVAMVLCRRYHDGLLLRPLDIHRIGENLAAFERVLVACASPRSVVFLLEAGKERDFASGFERELALRIRAGVMKLVGGDPAGARIVKGSGFGLTPSGDDLLAGFLLGLHALQTAGAPDYSAERRRIYEAGLGENLLSRAFLQCAAEGWYFQPSKCAVEALFEGSPGEVEVNAMRLLAIGATSGADLATGLALALRRFLRSAAGSEVAA